MVVSNRQPGPVSMINVDLSLLTKDKYSHVPYSLIDMSMKCTIVTIPEFGQVITMQQLPPGFTPPARPFTNKLPKYNTSLHRCIGPVDWYRKKAACRRIITDDMTGKNYGRALVKFANDYNPTYSWDAVPYPTSRQTNSVPDETSPQPASSTQAFPRIVAVFTYAALCFITVCKFCRMMPGLTVSCR
jgi:hypothetical protein